eukprot:2076489-Rhodomonas_salina.1
MQRDLGGRPPKACDFCRTRKRACDGEIPCGTCRRQAAKHNFVNRACASLAQSTGRTALQLCTYEASTSCASSEVPDTPQSDPDPGCRDWSEVRSSSPAAAAPCLRLDLSHIGSDSSTESVESIAMGQLVRALGPSVAALSLAGRQRESDARYNHIVGRRMAVESMRRLFRANPA